MPAREGALRIAFAREGDLVAVIAASIGKVVVSLDAALYRFNIPELGHALAEAAGRGVQIRLVLDADRFRADPTARSLVETHGLPFRLLSGRRGPGSKMHHKFAILDDRTVLTGSYNWTTESDQQNHEALLVVSGARPVQQFREEFEALWSAAEKDV
jgi:phosphatidylserine/phosphatidylglycerophosphate/cardiolipin synthase-like enzyme